MIEFWVGMFMGMSAGFAVGVFLVYMVIVVKLNGGENVINRNRMAKWVSEREAGKVNLPIAQISETCMWCLRYLATECRPSEVMDLLEKVSDEWKR